MNINSLPNFNINNITKRLDLTVGSPQEGFRHDPDAMVLSVPSARNRFDTVEINGQTPPVYSDMVTPLGDVPDDILSKLQSPFGPPAETTQFTNEDVSYMARALSALMDENAEQINVMTSFGMSEAQLAEHFGKIGERIDKAFAAGEITQQEYDDLNLGLERYTEAISGKAERTAAMWEVGKQIASTTRQMIENGASKEEMADRAESIRGNMQSEISKFVEEFCSIDRTLLAGLIQQVRGGESLFPEGTVHSYGRENTAGYFKNGYVPFVPVDYI